MFKRKPAIHRLTVGTSYQLNAAGDNLAEGLWLIGCTCGWQSSSAFFHTAQKAIKDHLGLRVNWQSDKIEVYGKAREEYEQDG